MSLYWVPSSTPRGGGVPPCGVASSVVLFICLCLLVVVCLCNCLCCGPCCLYSSGYGWYPPPRSKPLRPPSPPIPLGIRASNGRGLPSGVDWRGGGIHGWLGRVGGRVSSNLFDTPIEPLSLPPALAAPPRGGCCWGGLFRTQCPWHGVCLQLVVCCEVLG